MLLEDLRRDRPVVPGRLQQLLDPLVAGLRPRALVTTSTRPVSGGRIATPAARAARGSAGVNGVPRSVIVPLSGFTSP